MIDKLYGLLVFVLFFWSADSFTWNATARRNANTGGLSRANFPKGFMFGTASSAYQIEGAAKSYGRGPSIWDVFASRPGIIDANANADVTVDAYHRYEEDIDLMAKLNMDAYRFSISWSRIFPNGNGKVNYQGVQYYNNLINYLLKKGITPYANLYHYDLPEALDKAYIGWVNPRAVEDFANYAEFCFKTFGDRVKYWATFNEPRVVAALGYDNGYFAPGRCSPEYGNCTQGNSGTESYLAAHHMILSQATAVKIYREKYQPKQKGKIGIFLDFVWYEPLTTSAADKAATQRAREFHIGWFLHPLTYGKYPDSMVNIVGSRLPKFTAEQVKMVKGAYDFVGVNQYTACYMYDPKQPKPKVPSYQQDWNAQFARKESFARQNVKLVDLLPMLSCIHLLSNKSRSKVLTSVSVKCFLNLLRYSNELNYTDERNRVPMGPRVNSENSFVIFGIFKIASCIGLILLLWCCTPG